MSYNYQPPDMDDSSDIELVSHAPTASSSARLVEPVRGSNIDNGHHSATRSSPSRQDYADFFAEATTAASNASASMLAAQSGQDRRAGSLNSKTGTPANDIIEIGSDDSDNDGNDYIAGPSSAAAATYRDRGPSGHGHVQAGQPNILGRTHSAPSAVFDNKGKGKARLFEPIDSEDEDELPDLASIAGPGNSLKRSSSDTIAALSKRPSEQGSTTYVNERNARNGLSPIPASSPPLPSFSGNTYDYASRSKHNHSRLPSDVDSSDDEIVRPTKRRANPQQQPTSEADPGKVKPPTKKQLLEQERAAKKAQKEKEKAEKAEVTAAEKERRNGLKMANKLEDRQTHCKEIIVDFLTPLLEDTLFRDKIWVDLDARLTHLEARHSELGKGVTPKPGCFNKLILWRRSVTKDYLPDARHWVPRTVDKYTYEQEKTILVFLTGQEVEKAVVAHKFPNEEDRGETLLEMVANVRKAYGLDYQVILLVQNLSQKLKAKKAAENAAFQAEVRANGAPAPTKRKKTTLWDDRITMEDIEQEFVRLELIARCSIQKNEKYDDAIDWIVELTKDIAHRPYKMIERAREMYLNIDGRIESSDRGDPHKTYVNQLACINGVTEPIARAIAARFPTWKRLRDAFKQAPDPKQTLAGISILNRVDGAATNRLTGSALSERIYIFLTSRDPNLLFTGDIKTVRSRV